MGSVGFLSCKLPFVLKRGPKFQCSEQGKWEGGGLCREFSNEICIKHNKSI